MTRSSRFLPVLASIEVVGAVIALPTIVETLSAAPHGWGRVGIVAGIVLVSMSAAGGVLLFKGKRAGLVLSLIVQTLQVIQVSGPGGAFVFRVGLGILAGFEGLNPNATIDWGTFYAVRIGGNAEQVTVLINLLACFFLWSLIKELSGTPKNLTGTDTISEG